MRTPASEDERNKRLRLGAVGALLVGVLGFALALVLDPRRALQAYLFAYEAALSTVLGALVFLMTVHVAHARWPTVLRRVVESVCAALPVLALLFLPILLGAKHLYPWADPEHAPARLQEAIHHRAPYLNLPFFAIRALLYFAVWIGFSWRLRSFSLRQDADADPVWTAHSRRWSAVGIVLVGFTLTFAAFDWFMSLTPDWQSTVYGVYVLSGGFVAFLGLLAVVLARSKMGGALAAMLTPGHFLSLGKLLLSFVIFWMYIDYCQFFILWITNVPAEVSWWVPRTQEWAWWSWLLVVGHFALPFAALLSRELKKRPAALAAVGGWIVLLHVFDAYWLVMPVLHDGGPHLHWADLAALLLVAGACTLVALWQAARHSFVARGDPELVASLEYEGT